MYLKKIKYFSTYYVISAYSWNKYKSIDAKYIFLVNWPWVLNVFALGDLQNEQV